MSENKSNFNISVGSERSFGIVFSVVFLIISFYPLLFSKSDIILSSLLVSIFFVILAFTKPRLLRIPNVLWFKFGMFLGSFMAPLAMLIIFLFVFTPYSIVLKLFRVDLLRLKFDFKEKTYWKEKKDSVSSFKDQF